MRQSDNIERMFGFLHSDDLSDNFREWRYFIKELCKRQFTDGEDKPRP